MTRPSIDQDVKVLDTTNDAILKGRVTMVSGSETEVYVSKWDRIFTFDLAGETKLGRFRLLK